MNFLKLMRSIEKMDTQYLGTIQGSSNEFLQEVMDEESFHNNGPKEISVQDILNDITDTINPEVANAMIDCAIEFCMTNDYLLEGKTWNGINHLLKYHKELFTPKDKQYLKALNNSYMSIYKIISVNVGTSIVMENVIEEDAPNITVLDKSLSNSIQKDVYIAARPLQLNNTGKTNKYHLSAASVLGIPSGLVEKCIFVIHTITDAMSNPMLNQLIDNHETLVDNDHNRLLTKKMWAKVIIETWYHFCAEYNNDNDMVDYDGNPWHPCILTFDLEFSKNKVRKVLRSTEELKLDKECANGDSWLWLDKHYSNLNIQATKDKLPYHNDNEKKMGLYQGELITSSYDNQEYHIFAVVTLHEAQLIIEVNSKQKAHIAQDAILSILGDAIINPTITSLS